MMKRRQLFIVDPDMVGIFRDAGLDAFTLDEEPDLKTGEIITASASESSLIMAQGLLARGISADRVSYVPDFAHGMDPRALPIRHLHWEFVRPLSQFDTAAEENVRTFKSGFGFLDMNLQMRWRLPELCITAGPYASGKSLFSQILAMEWANTIGPQLGNTGCLIVAWEDMVSEVARNARLYNNEEYKSEWRKRPDLLDHIHFVQLEPDADRLVPWFIELCEYHRRRFGTRHIVLDPWNEMDHTKDARMMETDYIRDMMKAFRRLVNKLGIVLNVVTHVPAKVINGNGTVEPFRLAQAFGSVQFANKCDRGFCVVRSKTFPRNSDGGPGGHDRMIIRKDKSKVERLMGKKGQVAVEYIPDRHTLRYDGRATAEIQEIWRD
jgi:twinkle protein